MLAPSEAVLYRKLNQDRPTILLDEVDGLFNGATERSEPLRTLLNSGNRRGTTIPRCVGPQFEVKDFEVFGPKVLAGIDNQTFPETVRDRSIVVKMQRKTTPKERWLPREVEHTVGEITAWLDGWADLARDRLGDARPELPTELDDRAAEGWEALLAIADLAGGEWPARARRAALELSAGVEEEESRGVRLLRDIRVAFEERHGMWTTGLLEALNTTEEAPWGAWHQGDGLRPRDLARLLRPYEVKSRPVRLGADVAKGYYRGQFEDAWSRYCSEGLQALHRLHRSPGGERDVTDVTDVTLSRGTENGRARYLSESATSATSATSALESALGNADVADVADVADPQGYRNGHAPPGDLPAEQQSEDAWGRYLPQASQASQASQPGPRAERDVTDVTDVTDSQGSTNGSVAELPLGTAAELAKFDLGEEA
jgi:hypothetical protein